VLVFAILGAALAAGLTAIRSVLPFAILALGSARVALGAVAWRRGELPSLHLEQPRATADSGAVGAPGASRAPRA
jgi:hypothetical protein